MRIWSLHAKYLDTKGLLALWRETLLAQHVLAGKTKGYKNHPQLERFKQCAHPVQAINQYLAEIHVEATNRGYRFDATKIDWKFKKTSMTVSSGQVAYEWQHLLKKLESRDPNRWEQLQSVQQIELAAMFTLVEGLIASWEVL